jgi:hypothetical protein
MIIWRGWGAIPIGITAICVGLGIAMAGGNVRVRGVFIGLMLIAGGVATWFIGQHLNQTKPVTEFDAWHAKRRTEIAAMVQAGHYSNVPDPHRPGQLAEPWSVGQYVLDQEGSRVRNVLYNRHSLFFVPMQYFSFLMGAGGLVSIISALIPR